MAFAVTSLAGVTVFAEGNDGSGVPTTDAGENPPIPSSTDGSLESVPENGVPQPVEPTTTTSTTLPVATTTTAALATSTTVRPAVTAAAGDSTSPDLVEVESADAQLSVLAAPAAAAIAVPSTPRNHRLTSIGDGRLSFAWTAPLTGGPLTGYRLDYAPSGGTWRSVSVGTRTSYTLSGLRNGTNYYVYVVALNAGGASAPAKARGVPGRAPGGMSVPRTSSSNRTITLTWSPPSVTGGYPITKYALQARTNGAWVTFVVVPGSSRSYTVANLVNGRGYSFRIAAINARGIGSWSYHVIAQPTAPLPPAPPVGPGTFLVGTQVRPGLYVTNGGDGCYWERLSGLGGTFDEIIANDYVGSGRTFVRIVAGDRAFSSSRCGTWRLAGNVPALVVGNTFGVGMYRVNAEVKPGLYRSSGTSRCYWERRSEFTGDFDEIIANQYIDARTYVRIAPTDVGFYTSEGCGTWTRVSA